MMVTMVHQTKVICIAEQEQHPKDSFNKPQIPNTRINFMPLAKNYTNSINLAYSIWIHHIITSTFSPLKSKNKIYVTSRQLPVY
jgi:hypothetical protein